MDNLLIKQDLNTESFVREIIYKTKATKVTWTQISGTQFRTTFDVWQYDVSKTQISQLSYRYNLDVRKNGSLFVSSENGPLIQSGRESMVQDLYEVVEMIVLGLDQKLQEAQQAIQNQ